MEFEQQAQRKSSAPVEADSNSTPAPKKQFRQFVKRWIEDGRVHATLNMRPKENPKHGDPGHAKNYLTINFNVVSIDKDNRQYEVVFAAGQPLEDASAKYEYILGR